MRIDNRRHVSVTKGLCITGKEELLTFTKEEIVIEYATTKDP